MLRGVARQRHALTPLAGNTLVSSSKRHYAAAGANLGLHPFGSLTPWKGFVSGDIQCKEANEMISGPSRRGLFARRDMPYDKLLMRFPAVTYYVSDEPMPQQCKEMLRWVLTKMTSELDQEEQPFTQYVHHRMQNLMHGQHVAFISEEEVVAFLMEIPKGMQLIKRQIFRPQDINNLAMQLEFNRYYMEYEGRPGVAIFPEASLFNHQCTPNVELTFSMNLNMEYVVEARVCQPVKRGDHLVVSYIPNNNLPLTRLAFAMRDRWGFECCCAECRSRNMCSAWFIVIFGVFPIMGPVYYYSLKRQTLAARRAGFL